MSSYYENGKKIIHGKTVFGWISLTTRQIQYFCDAIYELRNIIETDEHIAYIRPINVDIKFVEFVDEDAVNWHTVHKYLKIVSGTNIPLIINKLEQYVEILRYDSIRLLEGE